MKTLLFISFLVAAYAVYRQIDSTQNVSQNLPSIDALSKRWKLIFVMQWGISD